MSFVSKTFEFSNRLIDVRYKGADPLELAIDCEEWLKDAEDEEWRIRDAHPRGGRFCESQLDLLANAKDRARNVRDRCREIENAGR